MKNMYKKLNDDCYISRNESRDISAFIKFIHGEKKEFVDILIFSKFGFNFTLECIIENDELSCFKTHAIDFNFGQFFELTDYWKETLESIFALTYGIYKNEYKEEGEDECM